MTIQETINEVDQHCPRELREMVLDSLIKARHMAMKTYVPMEDWQKQKDSKDAAYRERNQLVSFLTRMYPSHLKRHPDEDKDWEDEWRRIVCVHSPAGQLTWHIHDSELEQFSFLNRKPDPFALCVWDGHTTEEKYARLAQLPPASVTERAEKTSGELPLSGQPQ
jgi:hypothetical protein